MDENSDGRGGEDIGPAAVFHALRARGDTHVWWWRQPLSTDPADLALLGTEEFRQALCMRSEQEATAFVHTRAAARRAAAELLGTGPEDIGIVEPPCTPCGDVSHGPTHLGRPDAPLAVGLARTGGFTVLAVGAGSAVGAGAELLHPVRHDVLSEPWLTADEALHMLSLPRGAARDEAFYRCRARKRAVLDAVGHGADAVPLDRIESYPATTGTVLMHCPGLPGTLGRTAWVVRDLALPEPVAAAVAGAAGAEPPCGPLRLHLPGAAAPGGARRPR
ncbi:phosphopantetheinyl transferase [Streptomyces nitrosporeus]|uniref:phosphopantetheinyl transferase n=1 Tax=Streptomyces nitrosporeus TaxID=28894 RepID=UPI00167CCCAB|nr:phosphopantetheinyl transferase [Streptomyces nitrosporeus]